MSFRDLRSKLFAYDNFRLEGTSRTRIIDECVNRVVLRLYGSHANARLPADHFGNRILKIVRDKYLNYCRTCRSKISELPTLPWLLIFFTGLYIGQFYIYFECCMFVPGVLYVCAWCEGIGGNYTHEKLCPANA